MAWFTRDYTRLNKWSNCECLYYKGRDHCFNCIKTEEPIERKQKDQKEPSRPSWWNRWMKTRLNQQDIQFLTGWTPYRGKRR
jgi:hypothetical protein